MKGMVFINRELCKGCGYCVDTCPLGVIVVEESFNKKGVFPASPAYLEKCTGCCMCARMCPEIAIEVYREENEEEICNRD
jgi:2-oxoglutarate ferredoxin oxidoreductase subunit delta